MRAAIRGLLLGLALSATSATSAAEPVEFALENLAGDTVRLSDYRGRWVVVNFWATWCGPCLEEIPELLAVHRAHRDSGLVVLGINFEEIEPAPLAAFVQAQGIDYPVLRIGDVPLVPLEPLKGLPSTFFIDPAGALVASHAGPVTREAIEAFLAAERARSP